MKKEDQDFDPRVVLSQMIRNKKNYDLQRVSEMVWDLSNVGDDLKWKSDSQDINRFSNRESLVKDVNFMITTFLSRNNHIDKIIKKSRGGVADILNMLKEKYDINDKVHKSGTTLGSRIVTLPRIAGVFPAIAVRMFHDGVVNEIVSYKSFPGSSIPATHAICCPLLPSVAPQGLMKMAEGNFHPVMFWVAIKLDDIIHRKDGNLTSLSDIMSYYKARFQSAATPEMSRIKVFGYLDLVETVKTKDKEPVIKLTSPALALANNCLSALGNMRVEDESHDAIMKVIKKGDLDMF